MGYIMDLRKYVGHAPLMMPSAGVILVNARGEILMQRRADDGNWDCCGGAMEPGETFEECAVREVREETGLVCHGLELLTLVSGTAGHHVYPNDDEVYIASAVYICRDFEGTLSPQEEEVSELRFFAPEALPEPLSSLDSLGLRKYFEAQGLEFPDPCLRGASAGDRAGLGELYCLAWRAAYAGLIPDAYLAGLTPEKCMPRSGRIAGLVIEAAGRVVGHISFGPARDADAVGSAEIRALYILPGEWRQGLGSRLFAAACAALVRQGYDRVYLWVMRDNQSARRFYEKQGMVEACERTIAFAGENLAEVRYERSLKEARP